MTAILLVILLWQQGQAQKPVDPYAALKTPSITIVGDGDCMGDAMPARCYNPEVIVRIDWPKEHEREQRVQQAEPSQAAPFDVPPVTVTEDIPDGTLWIFACEPSICESCSVCSKPRTQRVTHETCADKSRFYLPSVDGKYHCLALGQKP